MKGLEGLLSLRFVTALGLLLLSLLLFSPSSVFSQAVVLEALIKGVTGDVEVRLPDKMDWEPAKAGMKLPEGTDIRTGPFSSADLAFEDSTAVLESFSRLTLNKHFRTQTAIVTRLNLKVGNVISNVKGKDPSLVDDYKVVTPTLVCSVRGTEIKSVRAGALYGDKVEMGAAGKAAATDPLGREIVVAPREVTDSDLTPSEVIVKKEAVVIDPPTGSTDRELEVAAKVSVTKANAQSADLGISKDPLGEVKARKEEAPTSPTLASSAKTSLGLTTAEPAPAPAPSESTST